MSLLVLFFVLNLVSGLFYFGEMIFQGWIYLLSPLLSIILLSGLIALGEYVVVKAVERWVSSIVGYCVACLFSIIYVLLISIDSFLYTRFGLILGQDSLFILAETNSREATEFISTYSSVPYLCIVFVILLVVCYLTVKSFEFPIKKTLQRSFIILALGGFSLLGYGTYSFVTKGDGLSVPRYSVLTRCLYGCYSLTQISSTNRHLESVCRDIDYSLPAGVDTIPHIVIVIGESNSFFHCSVYDYDKPTWPCMEARRDAGEIIAYRNVTTPYDATNWVMRSIFSLDPSKFGNTPIFPAIFHAAGYRTSIVENQYFVGESMTFLCDQGISDVVFDARQDGPFKYDGEMLPYIQFKEGLTLDIVHLVGQHLAYDERFPASFDHFHTDDYDADRYNERQRGFIAQYDNAGLYCDYVLDQIIRKYESHDCLLVFFPDHGEEVFETRDFCGHGSSSTAPDTSYLFHIPFFVWTSSVFREKHSQHIEHFMKESERDICTSHFSQWLVQTVGIAG